MTQDMMTLRALLEKSSDADLLREMIGFTAERLMALEVEGLTGAGSVRRFVLGPFCQTLTNLSPKMTANCVLASNHSRGGRFHASAA